MMKTTVGLLVLIVDTVFSNVGAVDLVRYQLYSRTNDKGTLLTSNIYNDVNFNKPLKFIVHGYFETYQRPWYQSMVREYLTKDDLNVVIVDWASLGYSLYSTSSKNTEVVGNSMADLILILYYHHGLPLSGVHLICHSLGAHVCGYAGKEISKRSQEKLPRITALDAAGPLFEFPFAYLPGLSKTDAEVVDAIHTDSGIFGRKKPTGIIDFYPNGGAAFQPGCNPENFPFPARSTSDLLDRVFCSHRRSFFFFIQSINNATYEGVRCDSWENFQKNDCGDRTVAIMGERFTYAPELTGKFYLYVNYIP